MSSKHPQTPPKEPLGQMRVDLRLPFAVAAAEALLLLGLFTLLAYFKIEHLPFIGLGLTGFYILTAGSLFLAYALRFKRIRQAEAAAEQLNTDIYRMFRTVVDLPYAVVNGDGMVRVINAAMQDILGCRSPVCNIPLKELCSHVDMGQIIATARTPDRHAEDAAPPIPPQTPSPEPVDNTADNRPPVVRLGDGRRYLVESYLLRRERDHYYFLLFRDVNDYLDMMDEADRNHVVLAYITLDNLQELTQFVRANYRATANLIEETLTKWVEGMQGMIREYDRDKYLAIFSSEMLDRCIRDDFSILDEIMAIRVGDNSFPLSVSMGIADIDGTMLDRERAANAALDMALQRGGNQVALQRRGVNGLTYFGGAHKTLESNTSISSRVSAYLLEKQLRDCDNVLIMSHANPDFDAIGSEVGVYRLCRSILAHLNQKTVPVHIVTNKSCDTFQICRDHLRALPEYEEVFMDKAAAQQALTSRTVLIITDVSNPFIFEAPDLVKSLSVAGGVSPIAIIDHHRLVSELPFTPFLHYIEATKSSASEIVSEILQQSDYAETLYKEEANLLLSGIMLDTHNFTRAAGAQTFEVTYYLYSRNAHTDVAREFFNEKMEELQVASDFDAHARLYAEVFVITWLSADHSPVPEDRIAASKAADKLLGIRGVEAAFAFAVVGNSIAISARSKGKINVQLIMEKLEGGGHFDMAGAQVGGGVTEAYELLCGAIDEYRMQFPEQFRTGA